MVAIPETPALWRWMSEDKDFRFSLGYTAIGKSVKATEEPCPHISKRYSRLTVQRDS